MQVTRLAAQGRFRAAFIQRMAQRQAISGILPEVVGTGLASSHQRLDPLVRTKMEQRFGQDFSQVRIHADRAAGESARSMNSRAYTLGRDIVFAAGQYDPRSSAGRVLLAHELTHVVQQQGSASRLTDRLTVSEPQDAEEREAEARSVGAATVARPKGTTAPTVQRDKPATATKFRPMEDEAAELEFKKLLAKYQKEGKTPQEAGFLAIDEMYEKRLTESGGTRVAGTATPGKIDPKSATWVVIPPGLIVNETMVTPGKRAAAIDDTSYNCHSYTFFEATVSKIKELNALADTFPKGEEPVYAGQKFYPAEKLVSAGINFDLGKTIVILPRWIIREAEVETLLKGYKQLGPSDHVAVGDIAIYSTTGKDYPHSGRVIAVDKAGRPTRIKSKWGAQSLFEHDPEAVPSFYGKPTYYRLKAKTR